MNKEQKKFEKNVKTRKKSLRTKRTLVLERDAKRKEINISKIAWKTEKNEIAEKRIAQRITRIENLKKTLKISNTVHYTLEELEKKLNDVSAKQRKYELQKNLLNS